MKRAFFIAGLLSLIILSACSDSSAKEQTKKGNWQQNDTVENFNTHADKSEEKHTDELDSKTSTDLYIEKDDSLDISPFKGINNREKCIYKAGQGKILIKSDKLYLFDIQEKKVIAKTQLKSFIYPETYFVTDDGYCLVGTNETENQKITTAYFYNKNLDLIKELNLTELIGKPLRSVAVSKSGNKIAYSTDKELSIYNLTEKTKQTVLNLGAENIKKNKGLISLWDIKFFDNDTKIAFMGSSTEENDRDEQTTFGIIHTDGSEVINEKTDLPQLQHMAVSDDYLAFSEGIYPFGTGVPAGKVLIMDNAKEKFVKYSLTDKNESSSVFLSEKGKYFMTCLHKDTNKIIFRIYDSKTGNLIREMKQNLADEIAGNYIKTYIEAFDDSNTFIAVSTFHGSDPVVTIHKF